MNARRSTGPVALALSVLAVLVVARRRAGSCSCRRSARRSNTLDTQIATLDAQLADAQHLLAAPNRRQTAAALATAKRALPDTPQMSNVLRQLSAAAATRRGPNSTASRRGSRSLPPVLRLSRSRWWSRAGISRIQKFARLLRQSADVKNGKLAGKGRLYTIDSIAFAGPGSGAAGSGCERRDHGDACDERIHLFAAAPPPVATTHRHDDHVLTPPRPRPEPRRNVGDDSHPPPGEGLRRAAGGQGAAPEVLRRRSGRSFSSSCSPSSCPAS